jgi:ubiquinone/menaquinone biosynthesis C-methylase UbiE
MNKRVFHRFKKMKILISIVILSCCISCYGSLSYNLLKVARVIVSAVNIQFSELQNDLTTSNPYDSYAMSYDNLDDSSITKYLGLDQLRDKASKFAIGKVLEVAVGTGIQLQHYDWNSLETYNGIDLSKGMLSKAQKTLNVLIDEAKLGEKEVKLEVMNVENLDFPDNQARHCLCFNM